MKTTINFNIEIKDLEGTVYAIDDMPRQLGNKVFTGAETIEVSDNARLLHKGESVEVSTEELEEITAIIKNRPYYKPWIHAQILEYLQQKAKELDKKNNNIKD